MFESKRFEPSAQNRRASPTCMFGCIGRPDDGLWVVRQCCSILQAGSNSSMLCVFPYSNLRKGRGPVRNCRRSAPSRTRPYLTTRRVVLERYRPSSSSRRESARSTRNGPSTSDNAKDDGCACRHGIQTCRGRSVLRCTERNLSRMTRAANPSAWSYRRTRRSRSRAAGAVPDPESSAIRSTRSGFASRLRCKLHRDCLGVSLALPRTGGRSVRFDPCAVLLARAVSLNA
jgi:hypothetical protein